VCLAALGFGTGLAPLAPGTFGSVPGLLLYLLLAGVLGWWAQLVLSAAIFALGIPICAVCARRLGVHDHPAIVWDEIAGCFLTCVLAPAGPGWAAGAFVAFRVFDIAKPWPIRELDHGIRGGLGIMLDDAVAAVMAAALLHGVRLLLMMGW
jgi:phosphatidylglycerophosphatase A